MSYQCISSSLKTWNSAVRISIMTAWIFWWNGRAVPPPLGPIWSCYSPEKFARPSHAASVWHSSHGGKRRKRHLSTVWWLPDVLKTEFKKLFQMELWTGTRWNVTNTECILNSDVVNLLYTCISLHLSIHSSPGDNPVLLLHIALLSAVPCVNVGC